MAIRNSNVSSFILRHIDPALWSGFKARASSEGRTLTWIIYTLIRRYVEKGLE
jgi:hypothetical protein